MLKTLGYRYTRRSVAYASSISRDCIIGVGIRGYDNVNDIFRPTEFYVVKSLIVSLVLSLGRVRGHSVN